MLLENLGIDATDPVHFGRFRDAALGTAPLTVQPDFYETGPTIEIEECGGHELPALAVAPAPALAVARASTATP